MSKKVSELEDYSLIPSKYIIFDDDKGTEEDIDKEIEILSQELSKLFNEDDSSKKEIKELLENL